MPASEGRGGSELSEGTGAWLRDAVDRSWLFSQNDLKASGGFL